MKKNNPGLTLIELLVTMALFLLVFGLITLNFTGLLNQSSSESGRLSLSTDIRDQQLSAMTCRLSNPSCDAGVYFGDTYYVLFSGSVYSPLEPSNYRVDLPETSSFISDLPGDMLVFSQDTGDILSYDNDHNTVELHSPGVIYTYTFNQLGVFDVTK